VQHFFHFKLTYCELICVRGMEDIGWMRY